MARSSGGPSAWGLLALAGNALTYVFFVLVWADVKGSLHWLDPEYRDNGFCVAEIESEGFNSYLACFILDTAVCVAALAMRPKEKRLFGSVLSVFVHGAFHLAQYLTGWPLPEPVAAFMYPVFILAFVGGFGVGWRAGRWFHVGVGGGGGSWGGEESFALPSIVLPSLLYRSPSSPLLSITSLRSSPLLRFTPHHQSARRSRRHARDLPPALCRKATRVCIHQRVHLHCGHVCGRQHGK